MILLEELDSDRRGISITRLARRQTPGEPHEAVVRVVAAGLFDALLELAWKIKVSSKWVEGISATLEIGSDRKAEVIADFHETFGEQKRDLFSI